jgi:hypothetical protein
MVGPAAGKQAGVKGGEVGRLDALERARAEGRQQVQSQVARVAVECLRTHLGLQDRQPVGHPLVESDLLRADERPGADVRPRLGKPCTCLLVRRETTLQLPALLPRRRHVDDDEIPTGGFLANRLGRHANLQARHVAGKALPRSAASPQCSTVVRR